MADDLPTWRLAVENVDAIRDRLSYHAKPERNQSLLAILGLPRGAFTAVRTQRDLEAISVTLAPALRGVDVRLVEGHLADHENDRGSFATVMADAVTRGALPALGLDPAALMALAFLTDSFTLQGEDGRRCTFLLSWSGVREQLELAGDHPLDGDLEWSDGRLAGPALARIPETVRTALDAAGRPLREIIRHPVLDAVDLTISRWASETVRIDPRNTLDPGERIDTIHFAPPVPWQKLFD